MKRRSFFNVLAGLVPIPFLWNHMEHEVTPQTREGLFWLMAFGEGDVLLDEEAVQGTEYFGQGGPWLVSAPRYRPANVIRYDWIFLHAAPYGPWL